ncbi:MAG: plasmid maintenance system antidote protein [Proteobacteria bacterium]|nr:MAG: plasmid maintenance system antidote protein [Pseudomonadota bacterium]
MQPNIEIIKGIHPGFFLDRELKKRGLKKVDLARSIHEHPQTITSITKGSRDMNIPLALRIEDVLELEEGYLMLLQLYYSIEKEKSKTTSKPDLSLLRPVLFWDTKMENINWQRQKRSIIARVFERGNEIEKREILRFYGEDVVREILNKADLDAAF